MAMTKDEIFDTLQRVRQAYLDTLDGKAVSFTGVNGRAITNHDPAALRAELQYWEHRWSVAGRSGAEVKLARFS